VRPDAEGLDVVALDEELVDEAKRRRRGQQLGQYLYIYYGQQLGQYLVSTS